VVILPALVELLRHTQGRLRYLTKTEAEWIARLRIAQPKLPPWDAIKVARRYVDAGDDTERLLELDRYVGLALWKSGQYEAVEEGIVSRELVELIEGGDLFGETIFRFHDALEDAGS
jgi:hypothetical protein